MNRAKGDNLITLRKRAAQLWPNTGGLYCELRKEELLNAIESGNLPRELCEERRKQREQRKESNDMKTVTCKRCGETGLTWHKNPYGRWQLRNGYGTTHHCSKEDFDGHETPDDEDTQQEETPKHVPQVATVRADKPTTQAATGIANALELLLQSTSGNVDADQVRAIVREEMANADRPQSVSLSLTINDLPPVSCDAQHERFPYLLALVAARVPVMLIGPAGSGKTTAAHEAAKSLNLPFTCFSCGPLPQEARLLGYMDANGQYVRTALREAYENGGVFLFDEIDAAHPGTLVTLSALLANSAVSFPDGATVERHPDFIPIAGANTFGTGADRQYVGRNQLDAATLDRFFTLDWGYDEGFEAHLLGVTVKRVPVKLEKSGYTVETWLKRVQTIRAAVTKHNIRHVVSPRASLYGAKLLDIFPRELLENGLLWKGLSDIQRKQVEGSK